MLEYGLEVVLEIEILLHLELHKVVLYTQIMLQLRGQLLPQMQTLKEL